MDWMDRMDGYCELLLQYNYITKVSRVDQMNVRGGIKVEFTLGPLEQWNSVNSLDILEMHSFISTCNLHLRFILRFSIQQYQTHSHCQFVPGVPNDDHFPLQKCQLIVLRMIYISRKISVAYPKQQQIYIIHIKI